MEQTVTVIGFAARKGNGSGLNEVCLVHRPAPDSGNSSRSTKNPARPFEAGDPRGQPGCRAMEVSRVLPMEKALGLWRRPLPLPQPSGGESGLEAPPDSPEGFLPFPSFPASSPGTGNWGRVQGS